MSETDHWGVENANFVEKIAAFHIFKTKLSLFLINQEKIIFKYATWRFEPNEWLGAIWN